MKSEKSPFTFVNQLVIVVASLLLLAPYCLAKEPPIQIEADKMTAVEQSQSVIFSGNVDARQGDVRIRSDEMTVFYVENKGKDKKKAKSTAKDAQQVEKIVCKGNVEVTSDEWLGTSDIMRYFSKKNLVQLIGNAKAYKGQNMVQGEQIDYNLKTGQSEVKGKTIAGGKEGEGKKKKGRVNMTILEN